MNNPIIELRINNGKNLFLFYKNEYTQKYLGGFKYAPWSGVASAIGHEYRGKAFTLFGYVFGFYKDVLEDIKNSVVDILKEQDEALKRHDLLPKEVRSSIYNRIELDPAVDKNYKQLLDNVDKLFSKALAEG